MKKANPKAVGGFVVGAIILAVVAVIVFGSGQFFQEREKYVAFFTDSLQGLRAGAPVQFRGVQIGTVADIFVQVDSATLDFFIPVILEINSDAVEDIGQREYDADHELEVLIEKGLRAQLDVQSFVTGQQTVQLILSPDTSVNLVETELPYEQVPTIPSKISQMEQSVGSVLQDISEVLTELRDVLQQNKGEMGKVVANITDATGDMKATMTDLRKASADVSSVTAEIVQRKDDVLRVIDTANEALLAYKSLAERANALVTENQDDLSQGIAGLRELEEKVSNLAQTAEALLSENRRGLRDFTQDGLYEIRNLAVDAQAAVEQFRRVMEEMERDPARFFLGKPGQVEVK